MLTVHDLTSRFNVSQSTIWYWVSQGIIPPPYGKNRYAHYGLKHIEEIEAYLAIKHNNVWAREAVAFCKEAGITLSEYVKIREQSIRENGMGVG